MAKPKPKAHELTTKQLAKRVFPKKAREAVLAEAQKTPKTPKKPAK